MFKKKTNQEKLEEEYLLIDKHLLEGENVAFYNQTSLSLDQMDYIYEKGWKLTSCDEYRCLYWFERIKT